MHRRTALLALASASLGLLALPRTAVACGVAAQPEDEEYIDGHRGPGESRELARHWVYVYQSETPLERRIAVSPDGGFCAVSDRDARVFRVFGAAGQVGTVPSLAGGTAAFFPTSRGLLLGLDSAEYTRLVVVNPKTGEHEAWTELLGVRSLLFGSSGVVVSHALPAQGGAAVSLVLGSDRVEQLVRGDRPGPLAARGNRIAVFDGPRARVFDLEEREPRDWGTLPSNASHALWSGDRLLAACETGLYVLDRGRAPRRLVTEAGIHTVFARGGAVVVASRRRALSVGRGADVLLHAPLENLTQVSPIPGSDDLLVVRGAGVRRLGARQGLGGVVARGREGFHLRGAAAWNGGVVTWSSRRWLETEGGGCTHVAPPAMYLVD